MMNKDDIYWQQWIFYTASLTEKLRFLAGDARLEVISHRVGLLDDWARTQVQNRDEVGLQREIVMWAHQRRCWYARTVIPQSTMQEDESLFARLSEEPLGQLIFSSPQIKRVNLSPRLLFGLTGERLSAATQDKIPSLQCIDYPSVERQWLPTTWCLPSKRLWGRLSTFMLYEKYPFYLYEIFLPDLSDYS